MGFIYLIGCRKSFKHYFGQTRTSVAKRWAEHKAFARRLIKATEEGRVIPNIHNSVLCRAMAKHGIDQFYIEEWCEVEDEKLDAEETLWIEDFDCIAPKGYNLTTGGSSNYRHAPVTIELMKQVKQSRVDNYRNEKLFGLPAKTAYRNDPVKGELIRINDHPLCKGKMFYARDYPSFDVMKAAVVTFLAGLEAEGVAYERKKRGGNELPKGIIETPKGFRVNKRHNGRTYDKRFEVAKNTKEENKHLALEWFEDLMGRLNA